MDLSNVSEHRTLNQTPLQPEMRIGSLCGQNQMILLNREKRL